MKLFSGDGRHAKSNAKKKSLTVVIALALIVCLAVGGTVAFLTAVTPAIKNVFNPANVTIDVVEEVKDNAKETIQVKNTGDTDAYIRVNLVTYYEKDGNVIPGTPELDGFVLNNSAWVIGKDGYYYHRAPVAPEKLTDDLLADGRKIQLAPNQVVYVLAEGIQSVPTKAVTEAWGVTVDGNGNITKGA